MSPKKIMIAIVVSVSTLGFILGYFVGQAVTKQGTVQTQADVIPVPAETGNAISEEHAKEQLESAENKIEQVFAEETKKSEKHVQKAPAAKPEEKTTDALICTVQVGAFKNSKDAKTLKQRLEGKGYKVYIKKSSSTKNAKLYKVRLGRFAEREDADALNNKLKKEGLKAFVTCTANEDGEDYNGKRPSSKEKTR